MWSKIPNKGTLLALTIAGIFSIALLRFVLIPLSFSQSDVEPTYPVMYLGMIFLMGYIYVSEILIQRAEKRDKERDNRE